MVSCQHRKRCTVLLRWGIFIENLIVFTFLRAVWNIPIQTLIISPWLSGKMIISQLMIITFKSITMPKCRDETRRNIELNPTKPKMNPKKFDQIRSMLASVRAEPGRDTETLWVSHDTPPFWKPPRAWGKFTDLYVTVPRCTSGHPRRKV